jgi:hypothetical protein
MKGKLRFLGLGLVPGLVALTLFAVQSPSTGSAKIANKVMARQLAAELGGKKLPRYIQHLSSGTMYTLWQASGALEARAKGSGVRKLGLSSLGTQGCKNSLVGVGVTDVRVNQDCSLRRQAEEVIVMNPTNHANLIAGQNDSRVGFNHCGYDWSFDGGNTWGDQIPPFYQMIPPNGDGHTYDACSDPSATFDAAGNAYITGVFFDINSAASAILVAKSNAGIGGAFYHNPGVAPFQIYSTNNLGVVADDNDSTIFNDKEFIVADSSALSPKKNTIYITWTRFNSNTGQGVGANSPIDFSQSIDGGANWSTPIEISGSNASACTNFSGEGDPNACDQDQGSHPVVGRDGTLYVAFGNGNTPTFGLNQHMIVSCPASANCSVPANWTAPVKISDDYGTQPFGPDSQSGCPGGGRQCLPSNGYRLDDFVEGSLSVDAFGRLYFVWADYRNGDSPNCPALGDASSSTPPCNNDVFYKYSTDGGSTWNGNPGAYTDDAQLVTPPATFGQTAQWQPWSAVSLFGKSLWVAFYDRHYGKCETNGCNDITLATVGKAATSTPTFVYKRLTTSSMPNLVKANNPLQAGFLGDYMWVSSLGNLGPLVVWSDTRGLRGAVEEDVYFAKLR